MGLCTVAVATLKTHPRRIRMSHGGGAHGGGGGHRHRDDDGGRSEHGWLSFLGPPWVPYHENDGPGRYAADIQAAAGRSTDRGRPQGAAS